MNYLTLVVELHHPLPGPGEPVGQDWAVASVDTFWPLLRAVAELSSRRLTSGLVIAISPSWSALAADPGARERACAELDRRAAASAHGRALRRFVTEWDAAPLDLLRSLHDSRALEVIPTAASHTWLPSIACEPLLARAQVGLAAHDHARWFGPGADGIWLPFRSYLPGLESVMADCGIRYFGVSTDAFLRGSVLPPYGLDNPLVTPPGVAAFPIRDALTTLVTDPYGRYACDPRYHDPVQLHAAAADHAAHFLERWGEFTGDDTAVSRSGALSLAAFSAHDLGGSWRGGPAWLAELMLQAESARDSRLITLGGYLDLFPEAVVGRPGPSAGGPLSVRPEGSALLNRCRSAADTLVEVIAHARQGSPLAQRAAAQMIRALLLAQRLDWSAVPGHEHSPSVGLDRSERWLRQFYELAGALASGRIDRSRLALFESGPPYLAEIDLGSLD